MKKERFIKRFCMSMLILAVVAIFLAIFPKQVYAENPRYGGILKNLSIRSPRAIGWPSSSAGPEIMDYYPCLEPLVRLDDNGLPVPFLATSWEYGPDRKTLTFSLRKGVKFHDDSDFNADAVKMNLDERKSGMLSSDLRTIESIDVVDEYTVRINLSEFKNTLLETFTHFNGLMVSPKIIEKAKTKKGKKWAKKNPVGTGPFKFVKFERDVMLKYERFDGYWQKGKPYLDGIETHYIFDTMTSVTAFRAGEAHVMWEVPPEQATELKKDGFLIEFYPGAMRALAPDSDNKDSVLADRRIREAIELAIDRKALAEALGYGFWESMNQNASKRCNAYNPDLKGRYNPERAKQLIKEAGYPNGFKIKMMGGNRKEVRDVLTAVQQDLKKVGIDTNLEFYDEGKYFFALIKGWKNGLLEYGQTVPVNFTEELSGLFKKSSARLPCLFRPLELQEVLTKAERVPDYGTQKSLVKKAVRMISDQAVVIPLYTKAVIYVMYENVRDPGFSTAARGLWTPENVWLSK